MIAFFLGYFLKGRVPLVAKLFRKPKPPIVQIEAFTDGLLNVVPIFQKLGKIPPGQFDDVKKHYIGMRVRCVGTFSSVHRLPNDYIEDHKLKEDSVDVSMETFGYHINTILSLSQYPQLVILERNTLLTIEGSISKISSIVSIEIADAKLFF